MKTVQLTLAFVAFCSATAVVDCNVDSFSSILSAVDAASSASVVYATPVAEGGSSFDPSPPFAQANALPELCAVKIEVQSSENSSYRFAVFLPTDWNDRMMTTGNGGFGGGINVSTGPSAPIDVAEL
jgi:feruloyl esterase